ncbi:MAG: ACT domain-containing protein, partial [Microbacterium sp.]|uniref:ACT domain-containing protein n=2 Tax=Microbacteriaceae TaxID=85023 RepID=UPI0027156120
VSENVSYVNAPLFAEQRGIETRLIVDPVSEDYRNITTLRGTLADGTVLTVSGTLSGTRMVEKIVGFNDYEIEVPIAQHHIVMLYTDRPGIVAIYGQKFGDAGINIAGLQVARSQRGAQLSVLTVDSRVPEELLDEVREAIQADLLVQLEITEV